MDPSASDNHPLVLIDTPQAGVRVLTLNRPNKANSLSTGLIVELCDQLSVAQEDPDIACVVLTGSERLFSAGADISGMAEQGVAWYQDPVRLARWEQIQN